MKIAVVGDVHDLWEESDAIALRYLGVDLVLFVGDFGNEAVPVVRAIASLEIPFAAILGNHDGWYTASSWGRKKCPDERRLEDRVQQQLDLLGTSHVGYGKLDFPEFHLTVVGGRPFSWGGSRWHNKQFYWERYRVKDFQESTRLIFQAASEATHETIIFMGHCGPKGLGSRAEDPCGKDWYPIGGDYGDPDLQEAIAQTQAAGKRVPLVAFGHMHHALRHTKAQLRKSIFVSPKGTIYLNAARVPRIVQTEFNGKQRNFSLVSLDAGVVKQVSLVWMNEDFQVVSEETLYRQPHPAIQSL